VFEPLIPMAGGGKTIATMRTILANMSFFIGRFLRSIPGHMGFFRGWEKPLVYLGETAAR
jgi:hypothetical protein